MLTRIGMPSLSATMEEGMIVSWRVKEGERIPAGGILAEIESDKSVFEYECPCAGVVRKLLVQGAKPARSKPRSPSSARKTRRFPPNGCRRSRRPAKAAFSCAAAPRRPSQRGSGAGPHQHIAEGTQLAKKSASTSPACPVPDRAEGSSLPSKSARRAQKGGPPPPAEGLVPFDPVRTDQSQGHPVETGNSALLRQRRWST